MEGRRTRKTYANTMKRQLLLSSRKIKFIYEQRLQFKASAGSNLASVISKFLLNESTLKKKKKKKNHNTVMFKS